MIELRLDLMTYASQQEAKRGVRRGRRVQPFEASSSSSGYSSYCDDGDVMLRRPALPRKRTPLAEDTYEFGVVRFPEIEI